MELYTLENLTLREVRAVRQGLNAIQISGIDALFIGTLQLKVDEQIKEIEDHINKEERKSIEEEIKRDTEPQPTSETKKS